MLNCRQSTDQDTPRQKHKAEHEGANAHLRKATRASIGGASSHLCHFDRSSELAIGEVTVNEQVVCAVVGAQLQSFHVGGCKIITPSSLAKTAAHCTGVRCTVLHVTCEYNGNFKPKSAGTGCCYGEASSTFLITPVSTCCSRSSKIGAFVTLQPHHKLGWRSRSGRVLVSGLLGHGKFRT